MIDLFAKLLIGHALCDYPLQGDFIGKYKSPWSLSPVHGTMIWPYLLTSHALIQAGAVLAITGNHWLALVEFFLHWWIDFGKCAGLFGFHADQWMHIACKLGYAIALSRIV